MTAVSQVSAEDVDNNVTITTEEIIQEEISLSQDVSVENLEESDAQDELTADTKSFSEIQNKINMANPGDEIHLSGYYLGSGNQITIDKDDITIVGDDDDYETTIDADGQSRIFYITGSNVILRNLYLINGYADYGGAVYGGNLDDCIVAYSEASYGGGLYYSNAYDCLFARNSAGYGGAMYDCYAEACDFINNTADNSGGAIFFSEEDNEIYGCYFENNTAGDDGGAIYNSEGSTLYLENCDFILNFASDDGGAIYNYGSIEVHDSDFYANEAGYWGGALYRCDAYNCTFEGNYAQVEGGAMYEGNAYACSFETEDDTTVGTEIYDDEPEPEPIESHTFAELQQLINKAKAGDTISISGIYYGDGTEITINKNNIVIEGEEWTYLDAKGNSRIFYITGNNVVLRNLVIRNGYAEDGGAVYCNAYNNALADHCIIGLNKAENLGGATYYCDASDTMFLGNSAERGGAMYGGNAEYCAFGNNTATNRGGAIYVRDGVTIDHCDFENNTAEYGGALYSCADDNTVSDCYFNNNGASDDGGAIYNNDLGDLTVSNSDFYYNYASDDGGAIYADSSTETTVSHSNFYYNEAGYWGGAMRGGTAISSTFNANSADRNGGGMYEGEAIDCQFSSNSPQNVYGTDVYRLIVGQIQLSQAGTYFGEKTVTVRVTDTNNGNAPVSGVKVTLRFSNGQTATVYTASNGYATYAVPFNPGTYSVTASIDSSYSASPQTLGGISIAKASATISPSKLNTKFEANKYFKVKVVNSKTKRGIAGVKLLLKVYTGKKAKKVYVTTDGSGYAYYNAAKLKIGKHKVKVSIASSQVSAKAKTSKITVKKASTALDTYDALYYYKDVKKGKYYIGIYNKDAGKYLKGIKLKVKVFTGKKSKTYTLKTKKDGFAILKTKGIKVGKHKVQITFKGNKKYKKATAKTTIEVSKKIPTRVGYYYMLTSHFYYGGVTRSANVFLKDMNGKDIPNKKITITSSSGDQTTGYSGNFIRLPYVYYGTITIKFAGDKKYMPSTYTIRFV